jgi:hypothetical protein
MEVLKKFLKKDSQTQDKSYLTASNSDVAWAKNLIDKAFFPKLEKMVCVLNKTLAERNIRAGIEIVWIFDKESEDEV